MRLSLYVARFPSRCKPLMSDVSSFAPSFLLPRMCRMLRRARPAVCPSRCTTAEFVRPPTRTCSAICQPFSRSRAVASGCLQNLQRHSFCPNCASGGCALLLLAAVLFWCCTRGCVAACLEPRPAPLFIRMPATHLETSLLLPPVLCPSARRAPRL